MLIDLNISTEEDLYNYYQNWVAGEDNRIHKATCSRCMHGSGMNHQDEVTRGQRGVWIGPFSSLELCHDYVINRLGLPATNCQFCL